MVPGKVVDLGMLRTSSTVTISLKLILPNLDMYKVHEDRVILPLATELNQAILCDDMPVLSTIQLGPTGRSVARSYAATINKLKAAGEYSKAKIITSFETNAKLGTPIGIDDGGFMTPDQKRYKQAMKILSSEIPEKPGRSLVELYTEKQAVYTKSVANKTKAFQEALQLAKDDPTNKNPAQIRQAYDQWVAENARTYRNNVQATYMDWVITGKKEEVEYWFSVVDQDSALARVERSKAWAQYLFTCNCTLTSMRCSGSYALGRCAGLRRFVRVPKGEARTSRLVRHSIRLNQQMLIDFRWNCFSRANKCLDKMKSGANQTKTAEWYTWEINRLEQTNALLEVLTNVSVSCSFSS
jgi:hypothetical protein